MKSKFKYKKILIWLIITFLTFPIIVSQLYRINGPSIVPISLSDLLKYYATVFSIVGSAFIFVLEAKERKIERDKLFIPKIAVECYKKDDVFEFIIHNFTEKPLSNFMIYESFLCSTMEKEKSINVVFMKSDNEYSELSKQYDNLVNVTIDDRIIDNSSNYPKYINIDCDANDGKSWSIEFKLIKNGFENLYMPVSLMEV